MVRQRAIVSVDWEDDEPGRQKLTARSEVQAAEEQ